MPGEIETLWQQGIAWLKAAGAEIVEVSLPHTKYALPAYYIVAPAEASSNLARYDGVRYGLRAGRPRYHRRCTRQTRAEGFGKEVRRRVLIGTYVLSAGYYDAYYLRAQKVRTLIKRDFEECFAAGIDALLTPATPSAAFGIGEKGGRSGRDVPERRLHGDGEHGGPAGHCGAGRARRPGPAARPAADRAAVRRGNAVLARRGARGRRRGTIRRSGGGRAPDGVPKRGEHDPRRCSTQRRAKLTAQGLHLRCAALWWAAKGDWNRAHEAGHGRVRPGRRLGSRLSASRRRAIWANARYWYRQAGRKPAIATLEAEWDDIATGLLRAGSGRYSSRSGAGCRGLLAGDATGGRSASPWIFFSPPSSPPVRMKTPRRPRMMPPRMAPESGRCVVSLVNSLDSSLGQRPMRDGFRREPCRSTARLVRLRERFRG